MHAVLVRVNIDDEERSVKELREELVPQISQVPGFVAGYWTRKDNSGVSLVVFESEEGARNASERVRDSAPTGVTIQDVEVREVVANA
jgi:hypothetical protein